MSFRRRLLLASTAAVAAAVALAAVLAYVLVGDTLRGQIDASLQDAARSLAAQRVAGVQEGDVMLARSALDGPVVFSQVFTGNGDITGKPPPGGPVPLGSEAELRAVARGERPPYFSRRTLGGRDLRVFTTPIPGGGAVQVARPLTEVDAALSRLRVGLGGVIAAGVALALVLGRLATRTAVKPVAELTETAEHVARTRDLTRRIEADGDDELSRLAGSFNTMLEALESSRRAQRQLVADASHELRTPLAAVRAYAELFFRGADSRPDDLARTMSGISRESERMSLLVDDLLLLARLDEGRPLARDPVELDAVVSEAVDTALAVDPRWPVALAAQPAVVAGDRDRLRQLVDNLLANIRAHTPAGTPVDVRLASEGDRAVLTVVDSGPGLTEEEAARAFERFYRADESRSRSSGGVGLGLSIVAAVAEAHGGTVAARATPGGGATFEISIPLAPDQPDDTTAPIREEVQT
jgi:signal transduction histidine kinase